MPYARYAHATRDHVLELLRSISRAEYLSLAQMLVSMGEKGWTFWESSNTKEILAYLQATPSERMKRKKWQDPDKQVLLKYSAYTEANKAYTMLSALAESALPVGASYRVMTVAALKAYYGATLLQFPKWPFDCSAPGWIRENFLWYDADQLDY